MTLRMRQICLVARELAPVVAAIERVFGLAVCYRDSAVGKYGLENALFPVGTGFLEVVAPIVGDTAAGRYLDRRRGDGGYMVITQCDDLEPRRARCAALGVRIANEIAHPAYRELQLHPRDVGGTMLSFGRQDQRGGPSDTSPGDCAADDPWHPAGGDWKHAARTDVVRAMGGAELQGDDPERLARRWSDVVERPVGRDARGRPTIALDDATLRFVAATDGRGEGLAGLDLRCADAARVRAAAKEHGVAVGDDAVTIGGMRCYLVR
ncbi:MAG: VOC family protein [Candidatus Rokubacteria bacterium]|nr:VOC family protein [Candidatus Rokubacteria bacterium]